MYEELYSFTMVLDVDITNRPVQVQKAMQRHNSTHIRV